MRTRIIQEDQDLALLQDDPEQVVRLDGVQKVYGEGAGAVVALAGVTMGFSSGSFTAVMGPSGSGKSTFLHVAAGPRPADPGHDPPGRRQHRQLQRDEAD